MKFKLGYSLTMLLTGILLVSTVGRVSSALLFHHELTKTDVIGNWEIKWAGMKGYARFSANGEWSSILVRGGREEELGLLYRGRWSVERGKLLIDEHWTYTNQDGSVDEDDETCLYQFSLIDWQRKLFRDKSGFTLRLVTKAE